MRTALLTAVILVSAALAACDEPYHPTKPTTTEPAAPPVVVTPPTPTAPPTPPRLVPLVITYAQGQDATRSLDVHWTPAIEPSVTVYWKREEVDAWRVIPGVNRMKAGELLFYPAEDFRGGRYRAELNGVLSGVMQLDGPEDGGGGIVPPPAPPAPMPPPVVNPPTPPAPPPPPSCKKTGNHCKHGSVVVILDRTGGK